MPATRASIDRDVKSSEILDVAEELLLSGGYEMTTMAEIARRAGVANNAVYWYFPSKDDVLAAVLRRRQERGLRNINEQANKGVEDQVAALLRELDQVANLTAAVHERARHSTAVAEVHAAFHTVAERYLREGFAAAGLGRTDAKRAAGAIMAMVEGIHLHDQARDTVARDELIMWTVRRIVRAPTRRRRTRAAVARA